MKKRNIPSPQGPKFHELPGGTFAFTKALLKSPRNLLGMGLSLFATAMDDTPYAFLNIDQESLLKKNTDVLAIFVPGFQLGAWSLDTWKYSFNQEGIPVLFPEKLPYGFDAVLCRKHPEALEDTIAEYVAMIRKQYPDRDIILLGHSYAGAQIAHVAERFPEDRKIIPVALTATLGVPGITGNGLHGLFFRRASDDFSGKTTYLAEAGRIMAEHPRGITLVDNKDGWLSKEVQDGQASGNKIPDEKIVHLTQDNETSPGHYNQNISTTTAVRGVRRLLNAIMNQKTTQQ